MREQERDHLLMLSDLAAGMHAITGRKIFQTRQRQYFQAAMALAPIDAEIDAMTDDELLAALQD
jgi:hypothetical protein